MVQNLIVIARIIIIEEHGEKILAGELKIGGHLLQEIVGKIVVVDMVILVILKILVTMIDTGIIQGPAKNLQIPEETAETGEASILLIIQTNYAFRILNIWISNTCRDILNSDYQNVRL